MILEQHFKKENIEINKLAYKGQTTSGRMRRFVFHIFLDRVEPIKKDWRVTRQDIIFCLFSCFSFFFFFCGLGRVQCEYKRRKNINFRKIITKNKRSKLWKIALFWGTLKPKSVVWCGEDCVYVCVWTVEIPPLQGGSMTPTTDKDERKKHPVC